MGAFPKSPWNLLLAGGISILFILFYILFKIFCKVHIFGVSKEPTKILPIYVLYVNCYISIFKITNTLKQKIGFIYLTIEATQNQNNQQKYFIISYNGNFFHFKFTTLLYINCYISIFKITNSVKQKKWIYILNHWSNSNQNNQQIYYIISYNVKKKSFYIYNIL